MAKDYQSMMGIVRTYLYDGPIIVFGSVKDPKWKATTRATSKSEARRNFEFRAKKKLGLLPSAKVQLTADISLMD